MFGSFSTINVIPEEYGCWRPHGSFAASTNQKREATENKLSKKQKARRLLEEKERQDKLAAKQYRKRNIEMLKADKFTRENDPNWKPGVSAACAKSGTCLQTFRDRHGE